VQDGEAAAAAAPRQSGAGGLSLPPGVSVTRFKGLGEMMPEQLWSTTLNPATRCGSQGVAAWLCGAACSYMPAPKSCLSRGQLDVAHVKHCQTFLRHEQ
jgi:hypothetical protein